MTHVLVLRPDPGASATVARARGLGLAAVALPLFEIECVEWQTPEPSGFDGLLLTSANAVRCSGEQLQLLGSLKVYAVGKATAETAREAGLDIAATGEDGVDRLLGSIDPDLRLLHPSGAHRHEPSDAKQAITAVTVYRSEEIAAPDLSDACGSIALVHSPRAGRRFAELVSDRSSIVVAAISKAAAAAAGLGWKTVAIADEPSDDALLALAARLCNKPDPE